MPKSKNNRKKSTPTKSRKQRNVPVNEQDDTLVDIVEVQEHAHDFFEHNQSKIIGITAAILLLIGGYLAYKYLVKAPKEAEATAAMAQAEYQFKQDSFALALTNPGGEYEGFEDLADNYGSTAAGNLSKYYAGISYLNLGNFDKAKSYLEDFKPAGTITPIMKLGALGDAMSELGDLEKAVDLYKKASTAGENGFLQAYYLKKLGLLNRKLNKPEQALAAFMSIKNDHPTTLEAADIDKYIALVK